MAADDRLHYQDGLHTVVNAGRDLAVEAGSNLQNRGALQPCGGRLGRYSSTSDIKEGEEIPFAVFNGGYYSGVASRAWACILIEIPRSQ